MPEYINELIEADRNGGKMLCTGTFLNPGSWDAALLAAGTTLSAMKHILNGCGKIAYALVRPPVTMLSLLKPMDTASLTRQVLLLSWLWILGVKRLQLLTLMFIMAMEQQRGSIGQIKFLPSPFI